MNKVGCAIISSVSLLVWKHGGWGMICFAVFVYTFTSVCVFLLLTHYFPDLASSGDPGTKASQQSYTELKLCNKYSALGVD